MTEGSASDSYQSNHVDKQTSHEPNVIAEEIPIVSQTLKKITRKRTIILVRNYNLSD